MLRILIHRMPLAISYRQLPNKNKQTEKQKGKSNKTKQKQGA